MYLTALVMLLFNTGYSFLSLKIGTTVLGFLTLPFIYLLGKELGGRKAGLWAMAFGGIAYWHNVISRIALRFTLNTFFTAPALYFLIRGMRRRSVNDFLISGFFLGLGLHGYSTMRIVPVVFVFALILYLIHEQSKGWRQQAVMAFVLLSLISFTVFLPLMRYTVAHPEMVAFRTLTRVSEVEHPYERPPAEIFLNNLWRAMIMFFVDNGEIWAHSVPHRPALDVVSAVLFFIGSLALLYRYSQRRDWQDLFIILSIPLLMMPSIMSLAFPAENPCLNRTSGAIIPVMMIIGFGVDRLLKGLSPNILNIASHEDEKLHAFSIFTKPSNYSRIAIIIGCILFIWSALQNYH
jgi:4-amino-4-deoxy-L-arabinose transferase-like glycosyltransferase